MPKFFYMDCVISNLERFDFHSDEFSACIDGRDVERLAMDNTIYLYLIGPGKNTRNRVCFYAPGFKKALTIARISDAADPQKVMCNTSLTSLSKLVFRPLIAGLLAWFAAWILMVVPVLSWYGANAPKGVDVLEVLTLQIGCVAATLLFAYSVWVALKTTRSSNWQSGGIAPYAKAQAPALRPIRVPTPKKIERPVPELVD